MRCYVGVLTRRTSLAASIGTVVQVIVGIVGDVHSAGQTLSQGSSEALAATGRTALATQISDISVAAGPAINYAH